MIKRAGVILGFVAFLVLVAGAYAYLVGHRSGAERYGALVLLLVIIGLGGRVAQRLYRSAGL